MGREQNTKISRGETILFSYGEYSAYCLTGEVVFTKDCDLKDLISEYIEETNPSRKKHGYNLCAFPAWAVEKKYCFPLGCREIHLGDGPIFSEELLNKETN